MSYDTPEMRQKIATAALLGLAVRCAGNIREAGDVTIGWSAGEKHPEMTAPGFDAALTAVSISTKTAEVFLVHAKRLSAEIAGHPSELSEAQFAAEVDSIKAFTDREMGIPAVAERMREVKATLDRLKESAKEREMAKWRARAKAKKMRR